MESEAGPRPLSVEEATVALQKAITAECAKRGGSCNSTPDGLLAVNATFDPVAVLASFWKELGLAA